MNGFGIQAEEWLVVNQLLDDALDLPASEHQPFLAALPAGLQRYRPVLERLLGHAEHVQSQRFLEEPPLHADGVEGGFTPGHTVGAWRLTQPIGEGGMACVWLAERCDGLMTRSVALKLPRTGWRQDRLAERFARERQILATLDHPSIARLLDAGVTQEGQPWLALEYVEGSHIDTYCTENQLGLRARLRLFQEVARAVAHAHTKLIIHRDLKPSNIMVTNEGQVRLLDFGIAKLLDRVEAQATALTHFTGRALTREYASPEQIAGVPLTAGSDIYSLGVLLYELVSGARPYSLKRQSPAALEEAIAEFEPPPPSSVAQTKAFAKGLRGDLDSVILKALSKDPAQRYATAYALADDIDRYLENRPVIARSSRIPYRFRKFAQRNRLAITAAILSSIALLSALVMITMQARIAMTEKQRAEETKSFVISTFMGAHAYQAGKPLTALEILGHAQERLNHSRNFTLETRVELLNLLGVTRLSLQDTTGAERAALQAVSEAAGLDTQNPQATGARLLLCWINLFRGETVRARADLEKLLPVLRRSQRTFPEDLASAHRLRAEIALAEADPAKAEAYARDALTIAESRLGRLHNQAVLALVNLGLAHILANRPAQSVQIGERAYRLSLEAYGGRTNHPNVLKARVALSQAYAASGDMARAMEGLRDAVADAGKLFSPDSRAVGLYLLSLAHVERDAGDFSAARISAERAFAILRRHLREASPGADALNRFRESLLLTPEGDAREASTTGPRPGSGAGRFRME